MQPRLSCFNPAAVTCSRVARVDRACRLLLLCVLTVRSSGCSNFLVSSAATEDGSTHIAYNSDGQSFYGYMTHLDGGAHAPGTERQIFEYGTGVHMGSIPQAPKTYNVIGNMNEKQVAISETTFDGRSTLAHQPGAKIDYYSLMWLALQRSATAREAIFTMDALTRSHGYADTGESFSVSDPGEVWHVDWIGTGDNYSRQGAVWVARRVPAGYVGAHANQARIRTWDQSGASPRANGTIMVTSESMWAADTIDLAIAYGFYPHNQSRTEFSFADIFDPISVIGARLCEARVWELFRRVTHDEFGPMYLDYAKGQNLSNRMPLFVEAKRKITLNDTMWGMRSHYDGTWFDRRSDVGAGPYHSPYRARPVTFTSGGDSYAFNRNIGYVGTFFHFVAQARASVEAGGIIWFGVDDAALSALTPMSTDRFSLRSAYWAFNMVANYAYTRWNPIGIEVQQRVAATERHFMAEVAAADTAAAAIMKEAGSAAAVKYLSNFSVSTADALVDEWVAYFPELFVKYRDGLVVDLPAPKPAKPSDLPQAPSCSAPGYDAAWLKRVVEDTGEDYLLPSNEHDENAMRKLKLVANRQ